jgi:hypothetical protein
MTVPSCCTLNHWRTMKNLIRVAKHQIQELKRLLVFCECQDWPNKGFGMKRNGVPSVKHEIPTFVCMATLTTGFRMACKSVFGQRVDVILKSLSQR